MKNKKSKDSLSKGKQELGQTSMEMLMIIAVALVLIVALIFVYQSQGASVAQANEDAKARNALSDLGGAAQEVYTQGMGAKKQVYVNMPSGIDPMSSYVSNRSIRLSVSGTDYVETEQFDMRGTLPTAEGGHLVWVVSEGNKVRIGYAMVELSDQTLLVTMKPNQTKTENFEITDVWGSPVNVSLSDSWSNSHVIFSMDKYAAQLNTSGSSSFTSTFSSDAKAIGIYVSEISIIANDASGNVEYIRLPLIVQVVPDSNERPPLMVIPSIFNATINRTENATRLFRICTNEETSLSAVDFTSSSGEPGSWMSGLESLGPMAADSCVDKLISASVPYDAAYANHTGYITLQGRNNAQAKDSIALLIAVGGGGDNEGPDVFNITTGGRVHVNEDVTIHAVADDNLTGGSRIKGCVIWADNETSAHQMYPSDGAFDNQTEPVHFIYTKSEYGGFSFGKHVVRINCTDEPGNVGPTRQYNFTIGKHILFVVSSGNASDWADWAGTYPSELYGEYTYDVATFADVMGGAVDLWSYDAVVFLDWKNDDDFVDVVLDYYDNGGYVGLFGDSAHLAVRDLNVTWHPDNPHVESQMNVMDNSHYVTQGFPETTDISSLLEISNTNAKVYEVWGDPVNSTELGGSGWFYPSTDRIMLAEVNGIMFWGVMDPWKLNHNGMVISTRVLDYMINQSLVE